MDMLEGVGRRSGTSKLLDIGLHSLNGYERNSLFRNDGDGTFTDVAWANAADNVEDGRGIAVLDFDRDGRLDIALRNFRQPAVLMQNQGPARHWIAFDLLGRESNRDSVGVRIRLRIGDAWQTRVVAAGTGYLSGSSLRQHFGLGDAERVDEVRVTWTTGRETTYRDLEADRSYRLVEGSDQPLRTARSPLPGTSAAQE